MKSLTSYITESQMTPLNNYMMVNEGLFSWIKRMWNFISKRISNNIKENNGKYRNDDDTLEYVINNSKTDGAMTFPQYTPENFEKLIKQVNSTGEAGLFFPAYKYYLDNHKKVKLNIMAAIAVKKKKETDLVGFLFGVQNEKEKTQLDVVNISLSTGLFGKRTRMEKEKTKDGEEESFKFKSVEDMQKSKEYKNMQQSVFTQFTMYVRKKLSNEIKKVNKLYNN